MSKSQVMTAIEASKERFFRLAAEIWNRPEISYQERESAALQKGALREFGFRVAELDEIQANAFIAEFGTGSPVVGLLGEYDALPGLSQKVSAEQEAVIPGGPGHGCGHNLLGTACLAAATGIRDALMAGRLKGTVRYYGCPAEEQIGKPALAKAGVFGGLDAVLCWHPADINTVAAYGTNASVELIFRFKGLASHAAQVPHLGRSALDALTLMSVGVEFLREHMPPSARVHYIVSSGGERPNIVPEKAEGRFQVRSPRIRELLTLVHRVIDVAKGAGLMTGTEVEWEVFCGCYDTVPNTVISDVLYGNLKDVPLPVFDGADRDLAAGLSAYFNEDQKRTTLAMFGIDPASVATIIRSPLHESVGYWGVGWTIPASTDVGDVSHLAPTAQVNTATWPVGVGSHTWQATAASGSGIGMKSMLYAAKVLAGAAYDLMIHPELVQKAHAEFMAVTAGETYVPVGDLIKKANP
jgi:aminobenzoyl-glutamate utilization protein B